MGAVKMRITIDVENGEIEDVQKVVLPEGKATEPDITKADYVLFDNNKTQQQQTDTLEKLTITRCHHTTILHSHSSPGCVYFHQRGVGWRRVCS